MGGGGGGALGGPDAWTHGGGIQRDSEEAIAKYEEEEERRRAHQAKQDNPPSHRHRQRGGALHDAVDAVRGGAATARARKLRQEFLALGGATIAPLPAADAAGGAGGREGREREASVLRGKVAAVLSCPRVVSLAPVGGEGGEGHLVRRRPDPSRVAC